MLTELCQEIKNWFERDKIFGSFLIEDGVITHRLGNPIEIKNGQYFRIIGSIFNDGVYKYPAEDLTDEIFEGAVWTLAIPKDVIQLSKDIDDWQSKYGGVDSAAMSPYTSESFGGYSYSKGGGGASDGSSTAGTWQGAFAARLNKWRKI